jgi:hypothetical protein
MVLWYQKSLEFDDMPENVSAEAVGDARFDYTSGTKTLIAELYVTLASGDESVKIIFRSKATKLKMPTDYITEEDLANKYDNWVKKFEKSLRTFSDLANRCALKSNEGVSIWIMSLSKPWQ